MSLSPDGSGRVSDRVPEGTSGALTRESGGAHSVFTYSERYVLRVTPA
jgi:hypothetical protein